MAVSTWLRGSFLSLLFVAAGCRSGQETTADVAITPEELLAGTAVGGAAGPTDLADPWELLALTGEMKEFLAAHVDSRGSADVKLRQLVSAIIDSGTFGLEYDAVTRTASKTFEVRRGNCLSFATMFVAMARQVGLDVSYQEVEIPPDWSLSNDTFVLNQHVNVHVDLGTGGKRVVDFNIADFRASYDMRTISDARAVAHYYNNIGVERMQGGDLAGAFASLRRALTAGDDRYAPAWTNLGTLFLRRGDRSRAEAAYLQALRASPSDLGAMSNLARLYELSGDRERSAAYQRRVIRHRNLNPYHRYHLAQRAYSAEQYDEAIRHLGSAIRRRRNDDRFYFLLALAHLRKGEERAARRWIARAEKVAAAGEKQRYAGKLEALQKKERPEWAAPSTARY